MRNKRLISYVVVFVLGFISISLWNFYSVIRPTHIEINFTPADFKLPSEDIVITTPDNIKLSGWFIEPTKKPERALIILHGYPIEKGDMLFIAESLYPDFSLLLLDLRYFGKSEGNYTPFGLKERHDIKAVLDFLQGRGYEKIGIFGFSLGGAVGFLSAAEDDRIDAVASYASFSDLRSLGNETYWRLWVLKKPMVELMILWSRIFFTESLTEITPISAAEELSIPIFITHGIYDNQINFSHAERLKEALNKNAHAEYYFFEKEIHGDLPGDFNEKLRDFFTRSL